MALSIGIVGLPNIGKSTIFNALSGAHNAAAENYPFCTVDPNRAIVQVPDSRLAQIAEITSPEKVTPTAITFVDIAGLVRNAGQGEGLGNQFLAHIGETDAILHVVRCFEDPDVAHTEESLDPLRDIDTITTELLARDTQALDSRLSKLLKQVRGDKALQALIDVAQPLLAHLQAGNPASTFSEKDSAPAQELYAELGLITSKPIIYCANVDDDYGTKDNPYLEKLRQHAESEGISLIVIAGRMESELIDMTDDERQEFLASYGIAEGALHRLIRGAYAALGLVSFFTIQSNQVQAWTVTQGTPAPQAAGTIHTDFEEGFIRAEVIHFADLQELGSEAACRSAGAMHTEGKDYAMQDGDIVRFLFKK